MIGVVSNDIKKYKKEGIKNLLIPLKNHIFQKTSRFVT